MAGTRIYFCCFLIGVLIANSQSSEENCNQPADIVITDSEALKKIEVKKTSSSTSSSSSSQLPAPTVIQQGNNLFIRPKFILGSPFTSYKQDSNPASGVYMSSKTPGAESNTVIGKPEIPLPSIVVPPPPPPPVLIPTGVADDMITNIPQLPPMVVPPPPPPPVLIPTGVADDIPIQITRIEHHPQFPVAIPNICESGHCPPEVAPLPPIFPLIPNPPILVENPESPVSIPEPPELPPFVFPELPIQVIAQRPFIPIPDHRIILQPMCPSTVTCNQNERDSPTASSIFNDIVQKFKNMMASLNNQTNSNTNGTSETDEQKPTTLPLVYPTLCVQGIIAERVVPNIITNDDVKVYMSPIPPYQLAPLHYYRK